MQNQDLRPDWYIICNPTSGGGISKKKSSQIFSALEYYHISYHLEHTQYAHQEEVLVQKAIEKGYDQFICIGGDGTIHHMINGIMKQRILESDSVKFAVIPTGTGNDWVKNHGIPSDPIKAVELIHTNYVVLQDVGRIRYHDKKKTVYFNNAAGIGYDAFVVKNSTAFKKWGTLAYLIAGLLSFKNYREKPISFKLNGDIQRSSIFLISVGIGKYSGGGMQLTNYNDHKSGNFDLTIIKSIKLYRIILQLAKLYNGSIKKVKEAECHTVQKFKVLENSHLYIQADGELIGIGNTTLKIIPKAIKCIVRKKI